MEENERRRDLLTNRSRWRERKILWEKIETATFEGIHCHIYFKAAMFMHQRGCPLCKCRTEYLDGFRFLGVEKFELDVDDCSNITILL